MFLITRERRTVLAQILFGDDNEKTRQSGVMSHPPEIAVGRSSEGAGRDERRVIDVGKTMSPCAV